MKFKHGTRRRALEYEKDWVQRWKKDDTFKKSVENRPKDDSYVFYDGPPFITGVPHHGTLLSSIVKDAVPRYWTMKGKRVERVWGWDCHGLPAENFVEKQLNIVDRRQIVTSSDEKAPLDKDGNELPTISLEQYITKARESMVANSATWEGVIDRIGRWVDFKGAYRTMDKDFMESVWWAFKNLYDAGKIYEGEKVLMYDTKFATPVSKAEVTMDNDAYQTVTDPSVFVKFRLKSNDSKTIEIDRDAKVIFVCNANAARSQMAQGFYNSFTNSQNAESAGLDPDKKWDEAPSLAEFESMSMRPAKSSEVMNELGIDITQQKRQLFTPDMIGKYDLVVNLAEASQTPEWLRGDNVVRWNVSDPRNESAEKNRKARDEIEVYVKKLAEGVAIDESIDDAGAVTGRGMKVVIIHGTGSTPNGNWFPYIKSELENLGAEVYTPELPIGDKQSLDNWTKAFYEQVPFELDSNTILIGHSVGVPFLLNILNKKMKTPVRATVLVSGFYEKLNLPHLENQLETFVDLKYDWELVKKNAGKIVQLHGDDDPAVPLAQAKKLADKLQSDLVVIRGGGHLNRKTGYVNNFSELLEELKQVLSSEADKKHLLAWTTTPWTLPANLMLAVNPEMTYCEVLVGGEKLMIAEEALERVLKDEKNQPLEYEVLRRFPGSELVGQSYEPLATGSTWPESDIIHKVYAADFVSQESGTGIVHVAPAYGEDDFELAKSHGVVPFHVIDDNGYYTDTNYKGLEVWDNNKFIAKDLKEKGIVWKIEYIRHEYPFNPRSKQRIMYRAIPSWFFDIQGSKPLMLEQNENINWFPPHLKHGRFAKNIEQAPDWNLSRDRFWATAMPVWKGDKGTVKVVGSYAELKELSGVELEDYHRPWVDDITFEIDGEKFTRIDKVLDGWFESGSMPFAQLHYPFENREKFEENYPADFIVEYVGQVRAWFYYVHAVNTELAALGAFGKDSDRPEKNAFKNVITTGVIAGNDGRKMSKSLGNFTDPNVLMDKFSADSLRFLLLSSPLLNGEDFALHDKDVGDVARKLGMVWNMYDFFTMYAEVDGWEFDPKKPFTLNPDNLTNPLDKWIVSRLHQLNEEVTRNMDGYNIPDALSPILPFLDDASNWYVRRSRRRFWKSEDDGDKNDAYRTLHYVLLKLSVILAPFTPFLAEELYQQLGGGNESVHLLDWPTNYTVDEKVVSDMTRTRELINTGLGLRMKKDEHQDSIKVRQPLQFASYAGEKLDDYYEQIMIEELNVKEIHHIDSLNEHLENYDEVHGVIDPEAWLEISKKITPELKREGLMREVIRFVQSARKNAGLNVDDRIVLSLIVKPGEADDLGKAIEEHSETIAQEALVAKFADVQDGYDETVKIEGMELRIGLKKL